MVYTITKIQARRFLLNWHHLTDQSALQSLAQVPAYINKVGCIQFDPLDPVGRNADLVLQSRLAEYQKGDIDQLLYQEKRLIDQWDKNMSICCIEDWPCFSRMRQYVQPRYDEVAKGVEYIRRYLAEHESASTADIELDEKIPWAWGPNRLARAALEWMHYAGEVVVHHKVGARRYYSLAHHTVPERLRNAADPNQDEAAWCRWQVLRRINSIGMLWNRGGDAWLGLMDFKSRHRESGFKQLLAEGTITPVTVAGIAHPFYIATANLPELEAVKDVPIPESSTRIIAALDNLIWERKMVEALFDFDYRWEVYVPAAKRRYGYYVLPVLSGERYVGRIEPVADKKNGVLQIRNFWWEQDLSDKRPYRRHIKAAVQRLAKYAGCRSIQYDVKI